ncbi:ETEC_3214 domain-containing protein [Vibrio maritimus]|uniref:ETEC_3214 domain-containing protein n=1 Tax=Vibrio maritimus TaxID=990268 RepID=UPI001F1B45DD|nr:ETEC_3214 domain-containing protein [Vibrio maritimus]
MEYSKHLSKAKSVAFSVAAIIVSIGTWSDTEAVIISNYQRVEATFTNTNEYNLIDKINVGHSFEYLSSLTGVSQAVKSSKIDEEVRFYYYNFRKFLLSVAVKQGRVASYSIQALVPDFNVNIPFSNAQLDQQSLSRVISVPDESYFESGNSNFYLDSISLGRDAMYNTLMVGSFQYITFDSDMDKKISKLDDAFVLGDEKREQELKSAIRSRSANTFVIGELTEPLLIEMLLSKFEYSAYFS